MRLYLSFLAIKILVIMKVDTDDYEPFALRNKKNLIEQGKVKHVIVNVLPMARLYHASRLRVYDKIYYFFKKRVLRRMHGLGERGAAEVVLVGV